MIHTYISSILMDSRDFKSSQDLSDSSGHRQQIGRWLPSLAMIPKAWEVQNSTINMLNICTILYSRKFSKQNNTHTHTLITHTFKKGFSESLRFPVPHGPMALGLRAPSDHGDLSWRTPMQTKRGRRPPVNCQQFGATTLSALSLAKIWRKQLHLIYPIIPILNNLDMNRELLKL